jgi:dihydroflavonol-4-reductase
MKIFIAGGTGLLGYHTALECLRCGDTVRSLAIPDVELGDWYPKKIELVYGDIFTLPPDRLSRMIEGCEGFVYAVGPDDRVTPPAPAYEFFHDRLVAKCASAVRAAKQAGVRRCVVLNSYFATFDRLHPEWRLTARHPYIRCRVEQAEAAVAAGGDGMDVCMLELPYIFGTMPGRMPLWKGVLVDRIRSMGTVFFPQGGTAMIAVEHVAQAIRGALERGRHAARYPIGDVNMPWKQMLRIMLDAMGESKRIVYVPKILAALAGCRMRAEHRRQGRESGLDPVRLFGDILCRFLYLDAEPARAELGFGSGGIEEAISQTTRRCNKINDDSSL